jgi:hypothetical protein
VNKTKKSLLPALKEKIPRDLTIIVLIILFSKILVFSLGYLTFYLSNVQASPLSIIMGQFFQWDSLHYMEIAKNGYLAQGPSQINIVFFPLYPLLIRLTTINFGYVNLSALLVSNASSCVAAFYLFKLAQLDYDGKAAIKAVLYLCIFPTAFFLSTMYTEGLFLALTIASFYYARLGKWPIAGLLSMFSALTRIGGLILLPALLAEYLHQKNWRHKKLDSNLLWIGLSLVGFLIYLNINVQVTGNPLTFITIESVHWHQSLNPVLGFQNALVGSFTGAFPANVYSAAELIFAVVGLLAIVAGFKFRVRPSYNVYMVLSWALFVSSGFWNSIPRYMLTVFPMFILMGFSFPSRKIEVIITALSIFCMIALTILFTLGKFVF